MKQSDLPVRWQIRLQRYIRESGDSQYDSLRAGHFRTDQSVRLRFPDGSVAYFRSAFCIKDASLNEVAVFTEHCGYHLFPLPDLEIETLRTVWPNSEETDPESQIS